MGIFSGLRQARGQVRTATECAVILGPHVAQYFSLPRLAAHSEEWKNKIKADFDARTVAILQAENPLLALRQEIATTALSSAPFHVLSMTAKDKAAQFYADCPLVSDELQHHLAACIEHHDGLREFWWLFKDLPFRKESSLDECVFSYALTYSLVGLFYANGFNQMRPVYKDVPEHGRDWFRPLILSCMIYAEDDFRSKIGLPSLLKDGDDRLYHVSFSRLVERGDRNPLFSWEDSMRRPHPYQHQAA